MLPISYIQCSYSHSVLMMSVFNHYICVTMTQQLHYTSELVFVQSLHLQANRIQLLLIISN